MTQKHLAKAFYNRGTAYYSKSEYDQAIVDFTQAIRLRPKDALALQQPGHHVQG